MEKILTLTPRTRRLLDIQGFECVSDRELASFGAWLRLPYALCGTFAALGTALASPPILLGIAAIGAIGAAFSVHPFDFIYNHGIRRFTGTGPLPKRPAPVRFGCGIGATWLTGTALAFSTGHPVLGSVLGFTMTGMSALVSTTNICVASFIYRAIFGRKPGSRAGERKTA